MVKLRTLKSILLSVWSDQENLTFDQGLVPVLWNSPRLAVKEEIDLWEQIYFCPATVGLYAAYQPYTDLYLIVYNLFDIRNIIEFHGENSVPEIIDIFNTYGISLPTRQVYTNLTI